MSSIFFIWRNFLEICTPLNNPFMNLKTLPLKPKFLPIMKTLKETWWHDTWRKNLRIDAARIGDRQGSFAVEIHTLLFIWFF